MTGSAIYSGWVSPPTLTTTRLCTRYTAFARPNGQLFGHQKSFHITTNCSSDTVMTVASDHSYSNKQVISVTPRIYDYLLTNVREPLILKELREETATMNGSQMQVSPDQAQLLAMLVEILGAKRCIEVGVYTGYSSLAVALVLPETGILVACERDGSSLDVAKKYYNRAGVSYKVDVRHGLAADTLNSMIENGEGCSYDFAFIDAEKRMYHGYFELLLQLVFLEAVSLLSGRCLTVYISPPPSGESRLENYVVPWVRAGGIIVIDNVLWHGKVADPLVNDKKTESIRSFNRALMEDERVSISMVPVGDGMTICRKR